MTTTGQRGAGRGRADAGATTGPDASRASRGSGAGEAAAPASAPAPRAASSPETEHAPETAPAPQTGAAAPAARAAAAPAPATAPRANPTRRRRAIGVGAAGGILSLVLVASIVVAVGIGPAALGPGAVWSSIAAHLGLAEPTLSPLRDGIVWELRLPRVLTAAAVGAGLSIAGVVMQAVTRNQLADPYLLGLSSGASVGAVVVLVLGLSLALPFAAFAGALAALAATLVLAGAGGRVSPGRTVLAGVAVSSVFGAVTSLVIFWSATGDSYREILNWLLGSLAGADWPGVALTCGALLVIGVPLLGAARSLDAFAFGDRTAAALGVDVGRTRWVLLGATALLTGALVSVAGSIGFVGLVLPHAVRLLVGPGHRALLPLSALAGAVFLIWADTGARTLFDPRELPVGILTALVGGPVFAVLVLRDRRSA